MPSAEKEPSRERETAPHREPRGVPETMTAAAIDRFGRPDVLTPHTLPVAKVGQTGPREYERLAHALLDAQLRAAISAEFPLERAADAHRCLEQGYVLGRIGLLIATGR